MKPKTTFIIIACLVLLLFVHWGFQKKDDVEREKHEYELTNSPKPTNTPTVKLSPAKKITPINTVSPTPTPTAEQKKQIEDSFKATCREYTDDTYESLMREDTKAGTRLCLEVKVVQKMEGIYTESYRVSGMKDVFDEEYVIYDYRDNDKTKILVGDILTIYGTFVDLAEFERSLTGNTVEIPTINAKYIDFVNGTSESIIEAKSTATPTPSLITFNQSGQTFSEYSYSGEFKGSVRVDDISYEFTTSGNLKVYLHGQVIEQNESFYIRYKLFDEDDYVVDDGLVAIDGLKSGDKFKNKYAYISNVEIKAECHRIEFSDR